ncbi:uncharacterized protein N7515_005156 [Penicillium bovifimosum]|uniref:Uncharacterized protein n=1 Tax=Penicillium bovifimosum TaxID=126998 RepID=A0A9W9H324_9EURO|nr:uncharacterized protein N7515_005156 [Penicillium bovifimosum]KAJ5135878.1 hypothetical protein N7515_005156 [Penicillium bovifimosum]
MGFWVDWELWQKLSLVSRGVHLRFCVLGWNRWRLRKYAATEAEDREKQAELYPMLHQDDIPFGARALHRGIEVEGIWISTPNTPIQSPCQPISPAASRPATPAPRPLPRSFSSMSSASVGSQSPQITTKPTLSVGPQRSRMAPKTIPTAARHGVVSEVDLASAGFNCEDHRRGDHYSRASLPINPDDLRISPVQEESRVGMKDTKRSEKRPGIHALVSGPSPRPYTKEYRAGFDGAGGDLDHVPDMTELSSHSPSENKRTSRLSRVLRRRSSEEFRRRMSQIFNENIRMGLPAEQLEFGPTLREYQRRNFRNPFLRPFRHLRHSSGNG